MRISSAALVWCFPSTGFLSLHAQWCNPEGTTAVVDNLCPGRTPLGDSSHGLSLVGHTGKHRGTEKHSCDSSSSICLGSNCWEMHPTPWFAGEGFNSSWPCLCSDLHVGRAGSAQDNRSVSALLMFPLGPSVLPTVTTSFLQWPSQYSFLLSSIG